MRLLFDARYTRTPRHDGISRYGAGVLAGLLRLTREDPEVQVSALVSDEEQLTMLPEVDWHRVSAPTSPREPLLAAQINPLRPDVVFSPMQTMGTWGRDYGLILTLHDLIYYSHPTPPRDMPAPVRGLWRLYHLAYWPQRLLLDRADAVATVSETTASLIAEHRLTRRPVTVVPNAADPLAPPAARPSGHDARALVYMGSYLPYKNVETLIRALAHLPGYTLHLVSRATPELEARLRGLVPDCARVVFHRGLGDEEYARLLDGATALVSASRAEGFGLPVVEAMARGLPVVLTDMPIFREITQGAPAARFFDPQAPADLAARVRELEDAEAWAAAAEAAPARAAAFSWDDSAARLLDLAREVHAQRSRAC